MGPGPQSRFPDLQVGCYGVGTDVGIHMAALPVADQEASADPGTTYSKVIFTLQVYQT